MTALPLCPQCQSAYTYDDGNLLNCPECGHAWSAEQSEQASTQQIRDSAGNVLQDGDTVTVIKDLKVKGTSTTLKRGKVVKNIRLTDNEQEIDCRVDRVSMVLRTEFVKKA